MTSVRIQQMADLGDPADEAVILAADRSLLRKFGGGPPRQSPITRGN